MGALLGNALVIVLKGNAGPKPSRNLMFCALGWGAVASAMLVPCLWLPGIGSMFRKANTNQHDAPVEQKAAPPAPSQMAGPQPTFVAAPTTGQPMGYQPTSYGQQPVMMPGY